ncbi:MAG TPA: hypothetical protein VNO75_10240 [Gemmatimonadaceae bacterium]|nr:hypothetical protein [Gemmatimonadaceae bacterium]
MQKFFVVVLALAVTASHARAQGALSVQGLGFPPGQMSARSEGSGGSNADFDPLSPINPAAIGGFQVASLFLQYSPEFRRVTADGGSASTTTARFPMLGAIIPAGSSWTLGFGASTFLDRSFETNTQRRDVIGDITDTVDVTERLRVLGAINDLRLGVAWIGHPKLRLGAGAHLLTGRNRVTLEEIYPDSAGLTNSSQTSTVSYTGYAGSVGLSYHPSRALGIAVSGRKGGELNANSADTVIASGDVPDRVSAGVSYSGITGAVFSARISRELWSSLGSLSPSLDARDGWDASVGAEATGPRVMQRILTLRAGARRRTLPFGLNGSEVREMAFMLGLGAPLTRDRASFDVAVQRAMRSGPDDVKERGLILSFGLRVSP